MSGLDPAIASALGVDASQCHVSSHGGSGFSSTSKISAGDRTYFLKVGRGAPAATMFEGEHLSLNAIHDVVPSLCPASLGFGELQEKAGSYFLVTDFLDLSGRGASTGKGKMNLAQKLAKLHGTPAPPPRGHADGKPMFGFPVTTCCGDTPQENDFSASWADFYAERRLRAIWRRIVKNRGGGDKELGRLVEATATTVVPRLLGDGHLGGKEGIQPVMVHGDLWSGNASKGRIGGQGGVEDVVYDPSGCYAHSEFELGIMKMFGGFGGMLAEYHSLIPKTEPVDEYEDRVALYEAYHHLNHYSMFGGGYRSGAASILERLIKKYGS